MKKIKILSLCLAAVLLLTACGSNKPAENTDVAIHATGASEEITETQEATVSAATEAVEATTPADTKQQNNTGSGSNTNPGNNTSTKPTTGSSEDHTLPTFPSDSVHIVKTPYGNLNFPSEWESFLHTTKKEGNPYMVTFFSVLDGRKEPQELFTISFGGEVSTAIGAVKNPDGGYVALNVKYPQFKPDDSWSDQEISIVFTMQEALNDVLKGLDIQDADVLLPSNDSPSQQPDDADMAVDTPYMELHYPSKWADTLTIKTNKGNAYSVGYYCRIGNYSEVHLFTVYFGGEAGSLLKTIKTENGEMVEIRIDVPELSLLDEWTEDQKNTAYAMQEDLNYLLAKMN